eukprot:265101_1
MSQEKTSFGFDDSKHLPVKLVIYDFDQTITCDHLYYELDGGQEDELKKMSDDKLLDVFGGKDRQQRLIQHFERIESTNCELIIISFGWVKVIQNALKRMQLYKYFNKPSSIIGKDSELLKNCNGSKAQCISKLKSNRKLRSTQILFIDDDNANIQRATRYCDSICIKQRKGMTNNHMKDIEIKCNVLEIDNISMNITTLKTTELEISKQYPSQKQNKPNKLDKYTITKVPKWFDNLSNITTETPVIQIGGDQTPVSESGEYELNVPILNNEIEPNNPNTKIKKALSLNNFDSCHSSDNEPINQIQQNNSDNLSKNNNKMTNLAEDTGYDDVNGLAISETELDEIKATLLQQVDKSIIKIFIITIIKWNKNRQMELTHDVEQNKKRNIGNDKDELFMINTLTTRRKKK